GAAGARGRQAVAAVVATRPALLAGLGQREAGALLVAERQAGQGEAAGGEGALLADGAAARLGDLVAETVAAAPGKGIAAVLTAEALAAAAAARLGCRQAVAGRQAKARQAP